MKMIKHKNILKEAGILILAATLVFSTIPITATNSNETSKYVSAGLDDAPTPQHKSTFRQDWFSWLYYDGPNIGGIGYSGGLGVFETAVRFTPMELSNFTGYNLTTVQVFHGYNGGPPQPAHNGKLKIYDAGTSTAPGPLLYQNPFVSPVGNMWFNLTLTNPITIEGDKDLWVSIEWTMIEFTYPAGHDAGPHVPEKGDWVWNEEDGWGELYDHSPYSFNWNIRAKVITSNPPETPQQPSGPTQGAVGPEYTFSTSTTDPEGDSILYQWDWGDGTSSEWLGPFGSGATTLAFHNWTETGIYEIKVRAKDVHNAESDWSDPLALSIVAPALEIGNISGNLFKLNIVIRNTGGVTAAGVNWSITLDGGFILAGKKTSGWIIGIPAGGQTTVSSDFIFGFGKTVITVSAETPGSSDTATRNASVFLFFIR